MNAASSVHGQPAWISSTGCCGWRLSRSKRPAGRACGTRLSGSPPPEWMCTGTPRRGGDLERALEQPVAHGLGVRARLAEAVLAPARERAAGVGARSGARCRGPCGTRSPT